MTTMKPSRQKRCVFGYSDENLYITEFSKSRIGDSTVVVGPYVRNVYLLHIVIEGTCHFSGFEVEEKEVFLTAKDKLQTFTVGPNYAHYWFGFTGPKAKDLLEFFDMPSATHAKFKTKDWDYVKTLLDISFEKCRGSQLYHQYNIAKSTFFSILPLLVSCDKKKQLLETDEMDIIAQYLRNNYQFKINMQNLADTIHISQKHMYKKFYKAYGVSPQQYLIDTRIQAAQRLLRGTTYKIKEIAASVGYSSQLDFSNMFKKKTGLSPKAYRMQCTKEQNDGQ